MVDTRDLKSLALTSVRVRVPLSAPEFLSDAEPFMPHTTPLPADLMSFDWENKYPKLFGPPPFQGFDTNSTYVEVPKGWYPLLDAMFEEIEAEIAQDDANWIALDQVKEKYGTLRVYFTGGNDKIDKIVERYEERSAITCERCAGEDASQNLEGWVRTLCPSCQTGTHKKRS